jgi:hypothetical protein
MEDRINLDMTKTYIYEGDEYLLTAERAYPASSGKTRRRRRKTSDDEMNENDLMVKIKPKGSVQGASRRLTATNSDEKWVKYRDLFIVDDLNDELQDYEYQDDEIDKEIEDKLPK